MTQQKQISSMETQKVYLEVINATQKQKKKLKELKAFLSANVC